MTKPTLRQKMIQHLQSIPLEDRREIEKKLTNNLLLQDFWKNASTIGVTISQNMEWDTHAIIEAGWKQGKKICIPKCDPSEKRLDFYEFESYDQLEVVYYNLQEPDPNQTVFTNKEEIDLLIVPGLLFDRYGYRIGFGGGFYDRFLTDFPNQTVSLFSEAQLNERIPAEEFDIPVQHLITETGKIK